MLAWNRPLSFLLRTHNDDIKAGREVTAQGGESPSDGAAEVCVASMRNCEEVVTLRRIKRIPYLNPLRMRFALDSRLHTLLSIIEVYTTLSPLSSKLSSSLEAHY